MQPNTPLYASRAEGEPGASRMQTRAHDAISAARRFSRSGCIFFFLFAQVSEASHQIKPRPPRLALGARDAPLLLAPRLLSSARHRAPGPELTLPHALAAQGAACLVRRRQPTCDVIPTLIKIQDAFPCGSF
jgi:hypothetical protein